MDKSIDNFEVLNERESSLSLTTSQMSDIRQSIEGFEIGRVHLCMGKVLCADNQSQHGSCYKYGTGCLIGGNKVLVPANILYSQRSRRVYEHIYFYPDQYLDKGFDPQSQKRIRIQNYYINAQYFNEMNEKKRTISVFDFALCELNSQDVKRLKFKQSSLNIGFRFDLIFQSQEKHELLLCKYSQHDEKKRHVLQTMKSLITKKSQDNKVISYKFITQEEERNMGHEDAFILYKVWQQQNWEYQIIGMHKGSQGEESYGTLLSEFLDKQDQISYHLKEHKQIDFNQLMKRSFNDLLKITVDLKEITDLQYISLETYIQQKQKYKQENEQLKKNNETLRQSQKSLSQKVHILQSENKQIQQLYLQQRQKYEKLKTQNVVYKNEKQIQIIQLKISKQNLESQIRKVKNGPTNKINQTPDINNLKEELKKMQRKVLILNYDNQNLKKELEQLKLKQIQSQEIIYEMSQEIDKLTISRRNAQNMNGVQSPLGRKVGIQRNLKKKPQPQIIKSQREENNQRIVGQQEIENQNQMQMRRDQSIFFSGEHVVESYDLKSMTSLIVQCGSFIESQQNNFASLKKKPSINNQSIASNLDNCQTIYQNDNHIQPDPNIIGENADQSNLILNKHNIGIFKNIYMAMSQMTGVLTDLDRKIIQVKELYEQKIKDTYQLEHPLKYLKKVYNNKKKEKYNYFINSKERVQNAQRQHHVKMTEKGFSLYLEKVSLNLEEFFLYDWLNLQFLKIEGCKIDSQGWEKFISKAHLFLPNLKVLRIQLNHKIQIKQRHLLNLWSIERIWFERQQKQPEHTVWSKNQVNNFIQNKLKNDSKIVKVQFRQIWIK